MKAGIASISMVEGILKQIRKRKIMNESVVHIIYLLSSNLSAPNASNINLKNGRDLLMTSVSF
jgi:hypothetical protein